MIKLAILTEGNSHIGYGHIARCSAIACAFIQYHVEVFWVLNGDQSVLSLLKNHTIYLFNWLDDKEQLLNLVSDSDLIVIDSYLAPLDYYNLIAEKVQTVICLDDFVRLTYPPGIVVNGTVGAEKLSYDKLQNHELLLGANYVMLRPPFLIVPPRIVLPVSVQTILITFGGTDPKRLTRLILPLLTAKYPKIKKNVVISMAFSDINELKILGDQQTLFFQNVAAEQMKELMITADIAVSAAGQTLNELARTGLPVIAFKVAENQDINLQGWMNTGYISSFIDATTEFSADEFCILLNELMRVEEREKRAVLGQSVVDGNGAKRIAKRGLALFYRKMLQLAEAKENDLIFLFNLANDEEVRRQSFSTKPISLSEHTAWFHSVLHNPSRLLYVFFVKQSFVGQVRFDLDQHTAIVSISLHADFRGFGLAPDLLKLGLLRLKEERGEAVKEVYAYVKEDNVASLKAFTKANFVVCDCELMNTYKLSYRL